MKLANPLYYPVAVLAGGIVLVTGVRLMHLPNIIILPTATAVTIAGATLLKSREPDNKKIAQQQLQKELQTIQKSAKILATKAETLRQEANQLVPSDTVNLELLATVQYACDRAIELPEKIDQLTKRIQSNDSLLSVNELEAQLQEVQAKKKSSSGIALQHLTQLAKSLKQNIELAKEGQNTATAQLANVQTLIQNSAGVLQKLQNKLRTADLTNSQEVKELKLLSAELNSFQENVDILIHK
ncbi:hypothetical protein ACE1B6_12750 [Aerosakkonemataceae cyanobacterium BLCC-F154]|uniref:Uncharacterized protein n=1 Tax=Floridaenema fluviatile BLCC-F154 TaxID=3153640 RepID=A0ABV4YBB9_9CYAN